MSNMDDDGDDKDDSKRRTRNLSEKKRRDQFNMLVNELSSMVSTNSRKMDKSTVLKSTISFLKNHNEITVRSRAHDVQEDWKPTFLSNEEFTYLVLEALEGFVMVFSATGIIYYVSESITSLLGHNPADVVNKSIFDLMYEEDRSNLYYILQENANDGDQCQPQQLPTTNMDKEMIRFQIHIRRGSLSFGEDTTYELVQFCGHFRTNMEPNDADHDMMGNQQDHRARILFVCTGRLCTPQLIRDVSLVDSSRSEFTSRHSLEWKFLFLDHRAPPIIGYLPFEVLGTSGYDYYHFDDLEKVVTCHEAYFRVSSRSRGVQLIGNVTVHGGLRFVELKGKPCRCAVAWYTYSLSRPTPVIYVTRIYVVKIMQKGELTSCYYRFLTKGQQWIWLQTRFYITYHQWNSKPEFVVCTHRVVSYADIAKSSKDEGGDADTIGEVEVNRNVMKDQPSDDAVVAMSPSYMSETSDAFGGSYQPISQPTSVKSVSACTTVGTVSTMNTAATAEASWPRGSQARYDPDSNNVSISSESRSNQRTASMETQKNSGPTLVPHHSIGAQYLDPAPYVSAVGAVGVSGVLSLPLPPLPVIVSSDQAQIQEQLQRKHEELQQMIVRQQEELRQVKEQLLLARLGILQPLINVHNPYATVEELQQQAVSTPQRHQITYENGAAGSRTDTAPYPQQPPQPPQPPHPPHPPMPQ